MDRTENDSIIQELNDRVLGTVEPLDETHAPGVLTVVTRQDVDRETVDLAAYLPEPRRSKGTIQVLDAGGFAEEVKRRQITEGALSIYADLEHLKLVAVLNNDSHGGETAGWRDYRVDLTVRPTPEWVHWKNHQGLTDQATFAEALETGELEIIDPPAAEMLDIAQTIHAHIDAKFKGGTRLANGQVQVSYEEEITTTAGSTGTLELPSEFIIKVRPFFGSEPFEVRCRFRFRPPRGTTAMKLGYVLVRPEDVERNAFNSVVDAVGDELHLDIVHGVAPPPAS